MSAPKVGRCDFCHAQGVPLVASLRSDPDQRVCGTCHNDARVPTELTVADKIAVLRAVHGRLHAKIQRLPHGFVRQSCEHIATQQIEWIALIERHFGDDDRDALDGMIRGTEETERKIDALLARTEDT